MSTAPNYRRHDDTPVDAFDAACAQIPHDLLFSELSDAAVRVYAAIQRLGYGKGTNVNYRDIGKGLGKTSRRAKTDDAEGMSDAKVKRAIGELKEAGWLPHTPVPGFVYVMAANPEEGPYKVGRSDDTERRRRDLQRTNPERLHVVRNWAAEDMIAAEAAMHRALCGWRIHGEFFACELSIITAAAEVTGLVST